MPDIEPQQESVPARPDVQVIMAAIGKAGQELQLCAQRVLAAGQAGQLASGLGAGALNDQTVEGVHRREFALDASVAFAQFCHHLETAIVAAKRASAAFGDLAQL